MPAARAPSAAVQRSLSLGRRRRVAAGPRLPLLLPWSTTPRTEGLWNTARPETSGHRQPLALVPAPARVAGPGTASHAPDASAEGLPQVPGGPAGAEAAPAPVPATQPPHPASRARPEAPARPAHAPLGGAGGKARVLSAHWPGRGGAGPNWGGTAACPAWGRGGAPALSAHWRRQAGAGPGRKHRPARVSPAAPPRVPPWRARGRGRARAARGGR